MEERIQPVTARENTLKKDAILNRVSAKPIPLPEITKIDAARYSTGFSEVDRVLGGGILPGAAILLGGEPGIGKSTMLLQIADRIASNHGRVLYFSGEESPEQIKLRADRLSSSSHELLIKSENKVEEIIADIRAYQPFLAIIDSIQTTVWSELTSAPGSVGQVRDCSSLLIQLAKETNTPVVLVGHVTKDGNIAGPRVLEHLVDVVLYFEGDRHQLYRILRGTKNRFGSTHEIGLFEMTSSGLVEVPNAAGTFAGSGGQRPPGSIITCTLEGNRPLLIEVQALVAPFHGYGFPRRTTTGIDGNRLAMILAVLEKKLYLPLGARDVFVNVTGGITISEPAGDLGIATAILSSYFDISIPQPYILYGEAGLSGEIRAIRGAEQRFRQAQQLGYAKNVIPEANHRELMRLGIPVEGIYPVRTIEEVRQTFFNHEKSEPSK